MLQAVTRAIGYLRDTTAVPLLAETIANNSDVETANLFLAEAAAEDERVDTVIVPSGTGLLLCRRIGRASTR